MRLANRRTALGLTGGAVAVYLATELYLFPGRFAFPLDDSYIHLQLARRLAQGAGLSYQAGDGLLPASTAPLWTALLSLGFLLPGALPLLWAKLLGILAQFATVAGTWRLGTAVGLGLTGRFATAALVGTSHWLLWASLSAMEIGLFAALSTWGLALFVEASRHRRGSPRALAVLAAAALARPEGYLLLAMALAATALASWRQRAGARTPGSPLGTLGSPIRDSARALTTVGLVLVPVLVFYKVTGGSFLPTTYAAKTRPALDLWPSVPLLANVLSVFLRSQPVLTLLAAAGLLRLLGRGPQGARLVALWPLALPFAYALLASDGAPLPMGNFGRYYLPLLPMLVIAGWIGLETAVDRGELASRGAGDDGETPQQISTAGRFVRAAVIATVLVAHAALLLGGPVVHARTLANVEDSDVRAARWLGDRLPPDAVLAVQDVGALKFLLPHRVIDLAGLVTPEVVPVLRGGPGQPAAWEERLGRYLATRRPDYLVVFSRFYPQLIRSPGFRVVERFEVPENITMAGDELVIVETPWVRHRLVEPSATIP